ncbi:MAG: peptidylprolyl isomerase [Cyanobacteria bacterium P01_H01_bin.26]
MISFGDIAIDAQQIVSLLKQKMQIREICRQATFSRIVSIAAQERGITISDDEVQAEADKCRHDLKLESAKDTLQWLDDQLITPDEWEQGIYDRLLRQKLATQLFEAQVATYFTQHRLNYEKAVLYRIVVADAPLAQELYYQITESETSFYQAAHQHDIDEKRRFHCGYEGSLSRQDLVPNIAAQVFGSQPKDIIGPNPSEDGYDLLMVETFLAAELTDDLRQRILNQLFDGWLERELVYLMHKD